MTIGLDCVINHLWNTENIINYIQIMHKCKELNCDSTQQPAEGDRHPPIVCSLQEAGKHVHAGRYNDGKPFRLFWILMTCFWFYMKWFFFLHFLPLSVETGFYCAAFSSFYLRSITRRYKCKYCLVSFIKTWSRALRTSIQSRSVLGTTLSSSGLTRDLTWTRLTTIRPDRAWQVWKYTQI